MGSTFSHNAIFVSLSITLIGLWKAVAFAQFCLISEKEANEINEIRDVVWIHNTECCQMETNDKGRHKTLETMHFSCQARSSSCVFCTATYACTQTPSDTRSDTRYENNKQCKQIWNLRWSRQWSKCTLCLHFESHPLWNLCSKWANFTGLSTVQYKHTAKTRHRFVLV